MGHPREACFYNTFADQLSERGFSLPSTLYSFGDMSTGEKTILLQDLSNCVQSGYFYGPVSPHNFGNVIEYPRYTIF